MCKTAKVSIQFGLRLAALSTVVANLSHGRNDQGTCAHEGYTAFELYLCARPLVTARQGSAPRCSSCCFLGSKLVRWLLPLPTFFLFGLSTCTFMSLALADEGCKLQVFVVSGAPRLSCQHLPESVLADEGRCWLLGHVVSGALQSSLSTHARVCNGRRGHLLAVEAFGI
jgi:hypothetical protein